MLLLLLACTRAPEADPAIAARIRDAAGLEALQRAPLESQEGVPLPYEGYTVRPVSLQVFEGFRTSAALWLPEGPGPHPAVVMAHGHFGEGKSSGESQGPAHVLAANGYAVLAVDTPGVEEGHRPGRAIHFKQGARNRALLVAAGTSAMALQLHGLQAGLDYLQGRGDVGRIGATGASGGAVQAVYLSILDPRIDAVVAASFVPMPREAQASGCVCDALPGWPGPDPALFSGLRAPSLWLADTTMPRPEGLPRHAGFQVLEGPHGYEEPMVRAALDFFGEHLGGTEIYKAPPHTPPDALASLGVGDAEIPDLLLAARPTLLPANPRPGLVWTRSCEGQGPEVVTLGANEADRAALLEAGLQPCAVKVQWTETDEAEAWISGRAFADSLAGAVLAAWTSETVGAYAVDHWAVVAERSGKPYVARAPRVGPTWSLVPGFWQQPAPFSGALARGDEAAPLVAALQPATP